MHELSIAVAVVESAERTAREHGADSVESIRLRIGELAGVVPDALRFSFEVVAEGTALAGAELLIEEVPARAHCTSCETEFDVGMPPRLWCPWCDQATTELLTGRELELASVRLPEGSVCLEATSVGQGECA